ncbi:MAG: UvrD-helicase domain-containing protein [Elusimicrobiota bacterium]
MENILNLTKDLNPPQQEAVEAINGPVLVLAGAGSGKTRVITYRIANMLQHGIPPWNILAVTFTNKAAGEMKERVLKLVGPQAAAVTLSTFHSFCARALREDGEKIGIPRTFSICDDSDQKSVIKACIKELGLDDKKFPPQLLRSVISKAKDDLMDPESYRIYAQTKRDFFKETVSEVYSLYQKKIDSSGNVDFGDLLLKTVMLLQGNEDILEKYRERFKRILVDEYQDTNHAQYMLIKLIGGLHRNICVVGDDDQSIYSWRGANIRNILEFEDEYPEAKVIKLEQNYRSTKNILDAAWKVVNNNSYRKEKMLWTDKEGGPPIRYWQSWNEIEEAESIAKEIEGLVSGGASLRDTAVFYRTNAQSRVLEDTFRRHTIPYVIIGSVKFYERKEIRDILSYLKFLVNKKDNISLKRIINVPVRGIGDASIELLESMVEEGETLFDLMLKIGSDMFEKSLITTRLKKSINLFCNIIAQCDAAREEYSAKGMARFALEQSGYLNALRNDLSLDAEARVENVMELVSAIGEYEEATGDITLEGFLEHAALVSGVDSLKEDNEYVTLMTLHLAKGLEFPNVFMSGMEEGLFPHNRSDWDEHELAEERRLCYVGMTRAMERLYLTCASQRKMYGQSRWNLPSRFIKEAGLEEKIIEKLEEKQAVESTYEPVDDSNEMPFNINDPVEHPDFGTGVIRDIFGSLSNIKVTVNFDSGQTKKLLLKYAKLRKVY